MHLFTVSSLQHFLIVEYLKLDIFTKTRNKVRHIKNLKYTVHLSNIISISYSFDISDDTKDQAIPTYSLLGTDAIDEVCIIRRYPEYVVLAKGGSTTTAAGSSLASVTPNEG